MSELIPYEALTEAKHIVVIAAHHDDIEFGCAGSIARWIHEGATVTYVIITDGSAGSNDPNTVREELIQTRRQEQIAAAKVVGVEDVRFLGYQDGELQASIALRRDLTRILRETKPYRVVCQDPTTVYVRDSYINHPDHRAAGEAALYATFPSSESRPIFRDLLDEGYEPHKVSEVYINLTTQPTHFVDIGAVMDTKIESLSKHVSQIGAGEDAENGALKFVRRFGKESGEKFGVDYAEIFRVMKFDRAREEDNAESATSGEVTDA